MTEDQRPEFGPSGYLPERASKRARKIVLRAQMGVHWIWAAVIAGVVVVIVGVAFLATSGGPPPAPFVAVGPIAEVGAATLLDLDTMEPADENREAALLVTVSGRPRLFLHNGVCDDCPTPQLTFCERTRLIESSVGGVFSLTGRARNAAGGDGLLVFPTAVVDGVLYADPTTFTPGGEAAPNEDVQPTCSAG